MKVKQKVLLALVGAVCGFLNGFFGGGGGMIVVPMLSLILKLEQKKSHATALAVILPVTAVSVIAYFIRGSVEVNALTLLIFSVSVTVGGFLGALLLKKASNGFLSKAFSVLMLVAGVKMIIG